MSEAQAIRGVLFDVDGTLYDQPPLRARMLLELAALPLRRGPVAALREVRGVAVFRRVRETLRAEPHGAGLDRLQYERAAERAGVPVDRLEGWVREWIEERPLAHLARCARPGLTELLDALESRGIHAGVFSDYPARAKLDVLGVGGRFDPVLCATDAAIDAFKPAPRGYLRASELWGLDPAQVLYVGDRVDVDAEGARRAGMPCAILGPSPKLRRRGGVSSDAVQRVSSFSELLHVIDRRGI